LVTYVSATIIILLLLISVFLISTAVASGIRVRRDEISILQYIGATDAFIKMPFWFEGILIGFCGAIVPLVLLSVLYDKNDCICFGTFFSIIGMADLCQYRKSLSYTDTDVTCGWCWNWSGRKCIVSQKAFEKIFIGKNRKGTYEEKMDVIRPLTEVSITAATLS